MSGFFVIYFSVNTGLYIYTNTTYFIDTLKIPTCYKISPKYNSMSISGSIEIAFLTGVKYFNAILLNLENLSTTIV